MDINKLEELARAATPGPWMRLFGERTVYDRMEDGCRGNAIVRADMPSPKDAANLDLIAAANPAAVLELIALIRKQEQALTDSNLALMEQTELAEKLRKQAEALEAELRVARAACDAQGELSDTYRGIALAATPPAIEAPQALSDDALNGQYFGKLLSRLVAFGFSGGHDNALIEYVRNYGEAKRALGRCDAVREYIESGMFEPATAPAVEDSRANGNVAPAVQSQPALAWMHTLADGIFGDEGWNVQFLRSQKEADEQLRIHGGSVTPLAALPSQPAPEAVQTKGYRSDLKIAVLRDGLLAAKDSFLLIHGTDRLPRAANLARVAAFEISNVLGRANALSSPSPAQAQPVADAAQADPEWPAGEREAWRIGRAAGIEESAKIVQNLSAENEVGDAALNSANSAILRALAAKPAEKQP